MLKIFCGFALFLIVLVHARNVCAQETMARDGNGWRCGSIQQLNELDLQANGARVNNFSLRERDEYFGSTRVIELSFSVANRNSKTLKIDAQMVGFAADQHLIFALNARPMMSRVSEGKTEAAEGSIYAMPDDFKRVAKICLKIMSGY